jgi:hypothetical protein
MFDPKETCNLTRCLLLALGIEIDPSNNGIYDQETKSSIAFDGKMVRANIDPNKNIFIDTTNDIYLDMLDPKCTKLMERFLGKFLDDSEELGNTSRCLTYYFDKHETEPKYRLNIKFEDMLWTGNWYYNKVICYDEAIISLDGSFLDQIDFRPYDLPIDDEE